MPSVILARNLAPSETARIRRGVALGFVTAEGSRTSQVSIMARSMGIPAVVGVDDALQALLEARTVAVDGGEGYVVANPNPATMAEFERKREQIASEKAALEECTGTSRSEPGTDAGSRSPLTSAPRAKPARLSHGARKG